MDGCRTECDVRPVVAGRAGSLDEQRDAQRILPWTFAGDAWALDAGRDIDRDGGDRTQRPGNVGRVETAGQGDRHFPGDGGGQPLGGARSRPARMRSARGVEEEPLDAGIEVGTAARHEVGDDRGRVGRLRGREVEDLPGPSRDRPRGRDRFRATELDDVGIELGDDPFQALGRRVGGDRDDERTSTGAARGPREPGEGRGLVESELAGRARDDVQPDRIGPGPDGREDAVGVGDAADLHGRPPRDVGRIVGLRTGRDEGPDGGGRIERPDQRLADERPIEPERPPASDEPGLTDPRFGDDEPVVRDELAESCRLVDIDLERAQVAVVEPDQTGAGWRGRDRARARRGPRPAAPGRSRAPVRPAGRAAWPDGGRPAAGRGRRRPRGASGAGSPRPRSPWPGPGSATAARTARRSSTDPPNQCGSHRTEIAAAPPAS